MLAIRIDTLVTIGHEQSDIVTEVLSKSVHWFGPARKVNVRVAVPDDARDIECVAAPDPTQPWLSAVAAGPDAGPAA